ncbi:elongation factor G 2 [Geobacter sp. OR-1]|uniref:elongation factor G n=1 Tax=Geobacter sp. OR-1 TaxID=1266765 RepID=UPI00054273B8|nr:elongation factor G [Geobacter sp. OR-1]GAM09783.1 elongation factor G 2 [Geobacter sp. OR-1]
MTDPPLSAIRNIGIISHIDAGKTTVSERILFYTGETHRMGEVHDGLATMDWMPQEQERGITITATATCCNWRDIRINLIDTPGHIDFTMEVERSMRVLDGAIAVFSGVEGVQPQSESVWRQAERYRVPRICFVNKLDRVGSDHEAVLAQMERRLGARPLLLQLPVGSEAAFSGVIDLLDRQMITFADTDLGMTVTRQELPDSFREQAAVAREKLVEAAADFDDTILTDFLAGEDVSAERLRLAIRTGTLACSVFPVLLGSALRNKGVQPLLDAVAFYLPSPLDVPPVTGKNTSTGDEVSIPCTVDAPLCALAFKVVAEEGRKLTYLRIYSGSLKPGMALANGSRGRFEKVARIFRMHAHRREAADHAGAGDIVAVTGFKDVLTGDTLCDPSLHLELAGMNVPEPVVSLAVEPKGVDDREKLLPALDKLQWEDPTFRVHEDRETGQTILTGMGELHLEIIIDRLARDFGVGVKTGRPQVVYRETVARGLTHREVFRVEQEGKAVGGEVLFSLKPLERGAGVQLSLDRLNDGALSNDLKNALAEAMHKGCAAGGLAGYPLTDLAIEIIEAPFEQGVTSEAGIRAAAQRGLIRALKDAGVVMLEPVMALEIITPAEATGRVIGTLQQKRGRIEGIDGLGEMEVIHALVPLAELFGYMTELRSATKGRGTFSMEFDSFVNAPQELRLKFGL